MTTLTDMQLSKKESKEQSGEVAVSDSRPRFPFGLEINLDDESLKKLGFDSLPEVGEEFIVIGVGPVTAVRENKRQGGNVSRNVEIQLQKIDVGPVDEGSDHNSAHPTTAVSAVSKAVKEAS